MSKFYYLILFFSFQLISVAVFAQCNTGTEPSCNCGTAPVLCNIAELDGFTYSMSDFQHPEDGPYNPNPFGTSYMCVNADGSLPENTTSHNPTWFAFIAWCTDLTLEINYSACSIELGGLLSGISGLQAAVFSECFEDWAQFSEDPGPYTYSVACDTEYELTPFWATPNFGSRTLEMTGLEEGKTYYFLVDGLSGSSCDQIEINVLNDCGIGDITEFDQEIQGPSVVCDLGVNQTFFLDSLHPGGVQYEWTMEDQLIATGDTLLEVSYTFDALGTYNLCVDVFNEPCILIGDAPSQLCKQIVVTDILPEAGMISASLNSCPGDEIELEVSGFNPMLDQYIIGLHQDTVFVVANNNTLSFNPDSCGTFTFLSLNSQIPDYAPTVGDSVIAQCDDCNCSVNQIVLEVDDTMPPFFVDEPQDQTLFCPNQIPDPVTIEASDNCGVLEQFISPVETIDLDLCGFGSITRVWSTEDFCGNTYSHQQVITIIDQGSTILLPDIDLPDTVSCAADIPVAEPLTWVSPCNESFELSASDQENYTDCLGGTLTRTWTYINDCIDLEFDHTITILPPIKIACDDGDICTVNDSTLVSCAVICEPCAGVLDNCDGEISFVSCDDQNDCTTNDMEGYACDGSLCLPCQGVNDNINPPTIIGPTNGCAEDGITLEGSGCNETLIWSVDPFGLDLVGTANQPLDYTIIGGEHVLYAICLENGCGSEATEYPITGFVADAVTFSGASSFCTGESTVISANPQATTWQWEDGTTLPQIEITSGGTYTVTITDGNGCINQDSITIEEFSAPDVEILGDLSACMGNTIELSASNTNGIIQWSTTESTESILVTTSGQYILNLTDPQGCESADTVQIEFINLPQYTLGLTQCFVDLDSVYTTINTSAIPESPDQIINSNQGEFTIGNQIGNAISFTLTDPNSGCMTDVFIPAPNCTCDAGENAGENKTLDCSGDMVTIGEGSPQIGLIYQWLLNGDALENSPTIEPLQGGSYVLAATDTLNNCTVYDTVIVDDIRELPEYEVISEFGEVIDCTVEVISLIVNTDPSFESLWEMDGQQYTDDTLRVEQAAVVSLIVTDSSTGCSATENIEITDIRSYPFISLEVPDSLNCQQQTVLLDAGSSQTGPTIESAWLDDQGAIIAENDLTIEVSEEGTYIYMAIDTVSSCVQYDTITVYSFSSQPILNVEQTTGVLDCNDSTLASSYFISGNSAEVTLSVYPEDGVIITSDSLIFSEAGVYTFSLLDALSLCSDESIITINSPELPTEILFDIMDPPCPDQPYEVTQIETLGGQGGNSYSINGTEINNAILLSPGEYTLTSIDAAGCLLDSTFFLQDMIPLTAQFEFDTLQIIEGQSAELTLNTNVINIESVDWSPLVSSSCTDCLSVFVRPRETTSYEAEITDSSGCTVRARTTVIVNTIEQVFLPNILVPSTNVFYPQSSEGGLIMDRMEIYDRWGNVVYAAVDFPADDPSYGWDGTFNGIKAQSGVYIYVLRYTDITGDQIISGDVTLLR